MHEIKNIFCDLQDVIIHGAWAGGLMGELLRVKYRIPVEEYSVWMNDRVIVHLWAQVMLGGMSEEEYFRRLILAARWSHIKPEDFIMVYRKSLSTELIGTVNILRALHEKGYRMFLVSDIGLEAKDFVVKTHEWLNLFEQCFFSCDTHCLKRELGYFTSLMEQLSLKPEETLLIDDYENNIGKAVRSKMVAL